MINRIDTNGLSDFLKSEADKNYSNPIIRDYSIAYGNELIKKIEEQTASKQEALELMENELIKKFNELIALSNIDNKDQP
jgi:hypothetical protein